MNIETRKLSFIEQFIKLQNVEIISQFEKMLSKFSANTDTGLMTSYELNQRVKTSMEDAQNGLLTENEKLIEEIEGWN
jgi:tellurite resistance protein